MIFWGLLWKLYPVSILFVANGGYNPWNIEAEFKWPSRKKRNCSRLWIWWEVWLLSASYKKVERNDTKIGKEELSCLPITGVSCGEVAKCPELAVM
jgi:hypothetical protein